MPVSRLVLLVAAIACSSALTVSAQPSQPLTTLEPVAEFGRHQPIGVAVSRQNRIFVTFPKKKNDYDMALAEVVNGQRRPFPDVAWNQWDSTQAASRWVNVQALFVDRNDHLWVLDPANPDDEAPVVAGVKLVHINLATNKVERIYRFEDLPRERSGLNDVRVDTEHQVAYLSDPKLAALVVLDLRSGRSRVVLQGHKSVMAAPGFVLRIDGKEVKDKNGKAFSSNVNGIALTHDFRYLYYRAINQTRLYRIATEALRNPASSPPQLAAQVEDLGEVGISHGMLADAAGNVYLTDSPGHAVRRLTPAGRLETVVQDARLLWPDSFGLGADGYLYLTAAQIERIPKWNNGQDRVEYPFRLYRMKL
ncbi:SMP-30/gluconolactonase/LRE family protein [Hymenobacter endophyticus]|uniref:L-dopachrome tautomerase-related protein n=1 Tax=Hymenobacter endophyticus TaxID=3076335 RepID=A0ABU3TCV8_9BACT|nr:L-dopachrome tautomerase-related protein [Hymenobacter endophyticus]MDU0369199.1 L-dopachrome tautomerase-related protein [Hymenobacter endophyticus]